MPGVVCGVPPGTEGVSTVVEQELRAERVAMVKDHPVEAPLERAEGIYHLAQDRPVIEKILEEELPPDEYYEALSLWMAREFPKADPALLEHLVPVVAAFDTATSFALSFGIAKFQLAQESEAGGRDRRPGGPEPEPGDSESDREVAASEHAEGFAGEPMRGQPSVVWRRR
jgi:hypothetical protein